MKIQFRTVKSSVPLIDDIRFIHTFYSFLQCLRSKRPLFIRSDRFLRSRRQFNFISEPKSLVNLINQLHNVLDFLHHLIFLHKNVGIVLHKTTCSHKPMQCYGFFISMNKSFNQFKIIIKSIFNCRTNGTFRIRIKMLYCLRQYMGARVPERFPPLLFLKLISAISPFFCRTFIFLLLLSFLRPTAGYQY